jgi:hypothetical protein
LAQIPGGRSTLVIHVSLYGYAKRGNATWLPVRIARWRRDRADARVLTMFHELYAFGPPWRSSFWLSPVQRRIVRQLLALSDHALTNTARYEAILRRWSPDRPVTVLPVFSNVGESDAPTPWCERQNTAVVFGLAGVERFLYRRYLRQLADAAARLYIDRIIDIGPRRSAPPRRIGTAVTESRGVLAAAEIAQILGQARYGFIACPPDLVGKSSTFAAYAAHGVTPVLFWPRCGWDAALRRLAIDGCALRAQSDTDCTGGAAIQMQLITRYASHSLQATAERYEDIVARLHSNDSSS